MESLSVLGSGADTNGLPETRGDCRRIGYIPIAVSKFSQDQVLAQKFIGFLLSAEGKAIFRKYHYLMDRQEALAFANPNTPVGGEYSLPDAWRLKGVREKGK